jgi:carboxyl-terminal processing protease
VLGKAMVREATYQHLKVFEDVVGLINSNYVEKVDVDKVMAGAMHGLADSLDPDSAYLTPAEVKQMDANVALPPGDVGIDLTRQYYLRIIAARDNSPAAKAGLRTGDFVRAIGDMPTHQMSVYEGLRRLRGAVGSNVSITIFRGNSNDPHVIELTREAIPTVDVTSRMISPGIGYVRISSVTTRTPEQTRARVADLVRGGATTLLLDVRRASGGAPDAGLALAKLFLKSVTLSVRETKGAPKETIAAAATDGAITTPATILIDNGTSGAAEIFASALSGNNRAELIGERTIGRAATQRLVRLPDGSGLWLSTTRYLTPSGTPLHGKGLEPAVPVDEPEVDFGQPPPAGDAILEKALERVGQKKAA